MPHRRKQRKANPPSGDDNTGQGTTTPDTPRRRKRNEWTTRARPTTDAEYDASTVSPGAYSVSNGVESLVDPNDSVEVSADKIEEEVDLEGGAEPTTHRASQVGAEPVVAQVVSKEDSEEIKDRIRNQILREAVVAASVTSQVAEAEESKLIPRKWASAVALFCLLAVIGISVGVAVPFSQKGGENDLKNADISSDEDPEKSSSATFEVVGQFRQGFIVRTNRIFLSREISVIESLYESYTEGLINELPNELVDGEEIAILTSTTFKILSQSLKKMASDDTFVQVEYTMAYRSDHVNVTLFPSLFQSLVNSNTDMVANELLQGGLQGIVEVQKSISHSDSESRPAPSNAPSHAPSIRGTRV